MQNDSSIFASFTDCPYKAFLQFEEEAGRDDALEFWFNRQSAEYRNSIIETRQIGLNGPNALRDRWIGFKRGSIDGELIMCEVGTDCEILAEDIESSEKQATGYAPLLCLPSEKISNKQKLLLAFAGCSLANAGYTLAPFGRIIHGSDHRTSRIQLGKLSREVNKTANTLDQMRAGVYAPPLILNSHCKVCRFSSHCRTKAVAKDDLSLISSVSAKEILKLNTKGIFSVTQLSYTYRARRGRRKSERIEKHSPALKALAIREKKIYVTPADKPQMGRVQIFFDIEGIPDKDFYYLIGAKVIDGTNKTTHSFWADSAGDEEKIWKQFLSMIAAFDSFSLLHFGGYESEFVARMLKRYGTIIEVPAERLKSASVNILTFCHLNVYFPTYSNSLKELATYLSLNGAIPDHRVWIASTGASDGKHPKKILSSKSS
jgi:predicted RecB family nuclease